MTGGLSLAACCVCGVCTGLTYVGDSNGWRTKCGTPCNMYITNDINGDMMKLAKELGGKG